MWKASFKSHPDKKTWKQNLCFLPLWFHSCWQGYPSCCCIAPSMIVEPVSSGFQCELKTSNSPVTFQTFSIRLGLLRCSISWSEQASKAFPCGLCFSSSLQVLDFTSCANFPQWWTAPWKCNPNVPLLIMLLWVRMFYHSNGKQTRTVNLHILSLNFFLFLFVLRTNRNIKTVSHIWKEILRNLP